MGYARVKVSASMRSVGYTRASGSMTVVMAKAMSDSATETSTWVTTPKDASVVKVYTHGLMGTLTMVNGSMALSMATACGMASLATATLGSGSRTRHMATASTSGPTGTNMKASGITAYAMAKVQTSSPTVTSISASTPTAKRTDTVSTGGPTEIPTPASSSRA